MRLLMIHRKLCRPFSRLPRTQRIPRLLLFQPLADVCTRKVLPSMARQLVLVLHLSPRLPSHPLFPYSPSPASLLPMSIPQSPHPHRRPIPQTPATPTRPRRMRRSRQTQAGARRVTPDLRDAFRRSLCLCNSEIVYYGSDPSNESRLATRRSHTQSS
ncbi:hypothetical protein BKA93DRAFT_757617 [Sparassis latifolia]